MRMSRVSWENKAQPLPGGYLHGTREACMAAFAVLREGKNTYAVWVVSPYGEVLAEHPAKPCS